MSITEVSPYDEMAKAVLNFQYPDTPASLLPSSYSPGLDDREEHLSECDSIIASLENKLHGNTVTSNITDLQSRISAYRKYRDFQRYLISPARKIPDEILSHIFKYVYTGCLHIFGNKTIECWSVLCVCVRWRNVTQSIPTFWGKFHISYFDYEDDIDSDTVPPKLTMCRLRVLQCLDNSRTTPLDISILPQLDAIPAVFTGIMADIAKHCGRWESLEIDGEMFNRNTNDLEEVTLLVETGGLSKLRKLAVDMGSGYAESYCTFDLFGGATVLEELMLHSTSNFPDCTGKFPWMNLRKITFAGCADYEYSQGLFDQDSALQDMPLLEELVIDDCSICMFEENPEITFPSLHTLHLGLYDSRRLGEDDFFYPFMITPNLSTLKVSGDIQDTSEITRLLEMVDASDCHVKCLELGLESQSGSVEIAVQIIEGLSRRRHIEELKLVSAKGYIGSLLEGLAPNDLLPFMKKLIVQPTELWKDTDVDLASHLINYIRLRENAALSQVTFSIASSDQSRYISSIASAYQSRFKSSIQQLKEIGEEMGIEIEIVDVM